MSHILPFHNLIACALRLSDYIQTLNLVPTRCKQACNGGEVCEGVLAPGLPLDAHALEPGFMAYSSNRVLELGDR